MKKRTLNIIIYTIVALTFHLTGQAQTYQRDYLDGKVYLKFKDNISLDIPVEADRSVNMDHVSFLEPLRQLYGIYQMTRPFDLNNDPKLLRTFELSFNEINRIEELLAALSLNNDIEYVEKVSLPYIDYTPNDSLYNYDYGYPNWNWHLDVINAEMAWDLEKGDPDIKVAIVDNAVWMQHPDLMNKLVLTYDVTSGTNNSNPPSGGDPGDWSHGTHCAGLSAAESDNGIGIASIGYNVSLIGVKASSNNSPNAITHWTAGVQWAANNGANVISMSFGSSSYSATAQNLINTIHNMGVVLLGSAGNSNSSAPHYPSAYNYVISVASTNEDDVKSDFSNYGTSVDISAPGGYGTNGPSGLLSSTYDETNLGYYDSYFGTSMSTPFAAGLAGLILSVNPELTPDQVENIMKSTCVNIDNVPGNENYAGLLGAGRIDAYAAISNTPFTPTADFTTAYTTLMPGMAIQFSDQSTGVPSTWSWEFQGGTPTLSSQQNPTVLYNSPGTYTVYLTVTNSFGTNTLTRTGFITVTDNPAPWVNFSASAEQACQKDVITFTDESLYNPTAWNWTVEPSTFSFVNGTTASSQNPDIRFEVPGLYSIGLTAENANGSSSNTIEDMILIEGIQMNFSEDFESGTSEHFLLSHNARARVRVDGRSAAPGSSYGLHFVGGTIPGGWTGGPVSTTPFEAWEVNTIFHAFAENCGIDATGISGVGLTFDLRQTFSIGYKYSWLRVLINGEPVADVYGNEDFNPATNTDPFETKIFDLSAFGGEVFSLTFQAACYLGDKYVQEGDNVFIDNIMISNTTAVDQNGFVSPGVLIYPNPAATKLNYSAIGIGKQVEVSVMNVHGQTMLQRTEYHDQEGQTRVIDLSGIPSGVYILKLTGEQGSTAKKFMVK